MILSRSPMNRPKPPHRRSRNMPVKGPAKTPARQAPKPRLKMPSLSPETRKIASRPARGSSSPQKNKRVLTNDLAIALAVVGVIIGLRTQVVWGDLSEQFGSYLYCVVVASLPMYLLAAAMKGIARSSVSKNLLVVVAVAVAWVHVGTLCNPHTPSSGPMAGIGLITVPLLLGAVVIVVIFFVLLFEIALKWRRRRAVDNG